MKTKFLALTALIALATSCSKSDEASAPNNFPADGVIRVATNVDALQTRAGWDDTDNPLNGNFSIWITPQGETTGSPYIYHEKQMNYTKNKAWTAYEWTDYDKATPLTMLWKNKTTPIDVVAFYLSDVYPEILDPTTTTPFTRYISANQNTSEAVAWNDLLYFKGTVDPALTTDKTDGAGKVTYALVGGKICIPFRHINAKLDLTVTLGTEFNITPGTATNPLAELKVNGTVTDFEFILATGEIKKSTDPNFKPLSIAAYHNAEGYVAGIGTTGNAVAKYECILIPQTVAANVFTVTFKIGDKEYTWTSPNAVTVEGGKQYTLALTAGKDIVTAGAFSATNWTDGGSSDKVTD